MIICPACGSKVDGDLCLGCAACGARSIGPPLANAEHQLRSYGRAAIVSANGAVMLAGFLSLVIVTLFQFRGFPFHPSSLISSGELQALVSAGEVVAWRLKWIALPIAIATLWGGVRMNRTIKEATVKRFHYDDHDQLRRHLADFLAAYNFGRRLKTLKGLTPYEFICKCWTKEPERFILDPIHQMPGLNT